MDKNTAALVVKELDEMQFKLKCLKRMLMPEGEASTLQRALLSERTQKVKIEIDLLSHKLKKHFKVTEYSLMKLNEKGEKNIFN